MPNTMSDQVPSTPEPPGKTRTWWHPLLASVLRWQLGDHYRVEEEVNVGKKPLQIDILLLHHRRGDLPESARLILAGLVEYLNEFTLIEFKSPSDTLRAGDFQTFLSYALLYRAQNQPLLPPEQLNLVVMAPRLTRPYLRELATLGVTAASEQPGVWRLHGNLIVHQTTVLETEVLADLAHPLLTVVSPKILREGPEVSRQLRERGYNQLVVYLTQQIHQFQDLGEAFAMQHLGADAEMEQMLKYLATNLPEEILEEMVAGKPLEVRLKGLTPEQRLEGLSAAERARLLKLLQQEQPKKPKRGKKT